MCEQKIRLYNLFCNFPVVRSFVHLPHTVISPMTKSAMRFHNEYSPCFLRSVWIHSFNKNFKRMRIACARFPMLEHIMSAINMPIRLKYYPIAHWYNRYTGWLHKMLQIPINLKINVLNTRNCCSMSHQHWRHFFLPDLTIFDANFCIDWRSINNVYKLWVTPFEIRCVNEYV